MNRAFHPRDCDKRLYVPRKDGGRGVISIKDCVSQAGILPRLLSSPVRRRFWKQSERKELKTEKRLPVSRKGGRTENIQGWKEMPCVVWALNLRDGAKIKEMMKHGLAWKKESLKGKQSLIVAAQDHAIRTNYVKATIDRSQADPKCRMCKQRNETIRYIVSACPKLAQKEYKKRHYNVARVVKNIQLQLLHIVYCYDTQKIVDVPGYSAV